MDGVSVDVVLREPVHRLYEVVKEFLGPLSDEEDALEEVVQYLSDLLVDAGSPVQIYLEENEAFEKPLAGKLLRSSLPQHEEFLDRLALCLLIVEPLGQQRVQLFYEILAFYRAELTDKLRGRSVGFADHHEEVHYQLRHERV